MNWRVLFIFILFFQNLFYAFAFARTEKKTVRMAVLSYRNLQTEQTQWSHLQRALQNSLTEYNFEVHCYNYKDLIWEKEAQKFDFVITNPGHYLLLKSQVNFTAPLATMMSTFNGKNVDRMGGVALVRAQSPIEDWKDLKGKLIAVTSKGSLGSYQAEALALKNAGINPDTEVEIIETHGTQENLPTLLLQNTVDAVFVRTGILESLVQSKKIDPSLVKVIHATQDLHYPFISSTELYPEWPVVAQKNIDPHLAADVISFLLKMVHDHKPVLEKIKIGGFTYPKEYSEVENLLKELKIPPYDLTVEFSLRDVWFRWHDLILIAGFVIICFVFLTFWLLVLFYKLKERQKINRMQAEKLQATLKYSASLNQIFQIITKSTHPHILLTQVTEVVGKTLDVDRATVYGVHIKLDQVLLMSEWSRGNQKFSSDSLLMDNNLSIMASLMLIWSQPKWIESHQEQIHPVLLEDGSWEVLHHQQQIKSLLWYPFAFSDDGYYLLCLYNFEESFSFSQQEMEFLDSVGHQVTLAIKDLENTIELKKNDDQLRTLSLAVEQSSASILITDKNARIEYVNDQFCKNTGYSREEVIGKNPRILKSGLNQRKLFADLWEHLNQKKPWRGEIINRKKNGEIFIEEAFLAPIIDVHGYVTSYIGIKTDVTERKKIEDIQKAASAYARSLIEVSLDPLMTISPDGKIMDVNQATIKVTGRSRQELIGSPFADYFTEPEKANEGYQKVFSNGMIKDYPLAIQHRNGMITPVLFNASVYFDDKGVLQGIFAAARDITDRLKLEVSLKDALEKAQQATVAKAQFLANMSHEIRTPMNGIIGLSQIALNEPGSPTVHSYLEKINNASRSLLGILNDILDFSKLESGGIKIEQISMDLDVILGNIISLFEERALSKHLTFNVELDPLVPHWLLSDPLRIQQILANLVSNSIKFTKQGSVKIKVICLQRKNDTAVLEFRVMDSGIGIETEVLQKLFKPFSQADSSITRRFGGTGLGLSICKELLHLLGSEMKVESLVGVGSTFSFQLNVLIDIEAEGKMAKKQNTTPKAGYLKDQLASMAHKLQGCKILVAEDDPINQLVVEKFLEIAGVKCVIAHNGQEAIEVLNRETTPPIDIVLMDIQMPVLDGIQATAQIRQNPLFKKLPILALTAGVTKEEQTQAFAAGMNGFLTKPIRYKELMDALSQWVNPSQSKNNAA